MMKSRGAVGLAALFLMELSAASKGLSHSHRHLETRQIPYQLVGCYSSAGGSPSTQGAGYWKYQSSSWCGNACKAIGKPVASITLGTTCYCSELLPAQSDGLDESKCDIICAGYGQDTCGGDGTFKVFLTGINPSVGAVAPDRIFNPQQSSSPDPPPPHADTSTVVVHSTKAVAATTVVHNQKTVVRTIQADPTSSLDANDGANIGVNADTESSGTQSGGGHTSTGATVGIAVGVVAGILGLAALVILTVFYLRRRRRMKNAENGHARADSLNAFVAAGSTHTPSPGNDSRLDPRAMVDLRRQSAGSVFADNQDYSRRILKVTNPEQD